MRRVGFLQREMHSMNFVDLPTQFQVEVVEENPNTDSDSAPEKRSNHPHREQMRVVLSSRQSDVVAGKQASTAQDVLRKALVTVERHAPRNGKTPKDIFDHQLSRMCRQTISKLWGSWSAKFTMKRSLKIAYTRRKIVSTNRR